MKFFTDAFYDRNTPYEDIKGTFESYKRHMEILRDRMPAKAFEFASASWHYDDGTIGLHDSWIESVVLREIAEGEHREIRSLEIDVELLGAYHDRVINLHYTGVREYDLSKQSETHGHGDWLTDEFDLTDEGLVIHEVHFANGGSWRIVCKDVEFSERQL
ncbi:MAG: hypothetical protein ABL984_02440 [Pyrinomonadaceae bacterium]